MICIIGVPSGTSKLPGLFTCPDTDTTFVPGLRSVPHCRNHRAPLLTMCGTFASVSTLLMIVGHP